MPDNRYLFINCRDHVLYYVDPLEKRNYHEVMKKQKKGKMTLDVLAGMVARGFQETAKKDEVDAQFKEVNKRLDKIENLILADHKRRIEKLEISSATCSTDWLKGEVQANYIVCLYTSPIFLSKSRKGKHKNAQTQLMPHSKRNGASFCLFNSLNDTLKLVKLIENFISKP